MENRNSGIKTSLTRLNVIGYAMGDMAGVISFGAIGSFLQMYYTDVLNISLAKITVLLMVARIWDAINDPLCGALIDHAKPNKEGRFRPYVWKFSIPLAIAFVLTFLKIPGLSENGYLVYAYVSYIAYGMLYTAVSIPYGSMASVMTTDAKERSDLSVIRSLGAGLGSVISQILLPLFVFSSTAAGAKYLDSTKMLRMVIIMAILSVIIYYGFYRLTREYIEAPATQKQEAMFKTVKSLFHNRPFVALCLGSMVLIGGNWYTQTIFNYLFKNYFEQPKLFSLVTVFTYIPMLILMPLMSKLVLRFGKQEVCSFGSIFTAASYLLLFFIRTTNPLLFLGVILISGFGLTFFTLEVWAMVNDVIDYQEILSGRRDEGITYASFSFFRKVGQTLAGAGSSIALAIIGYQTAAGTITQTTDVNQGIYTIATLVPFFIYLAMFVFLRFGYTLRKDSMYELLENSEYSEGDQ